MPMDVVCPKCGSKLKAPENIAGKVVRCKKCQEKFRVPGGQAGDPVGDTQQLSSMGSKFQLPADPAPATLPTPSPLPAPPAALFPEDSALHVTPPAAKPIPVPSDELLILDDPIPKAALITIPTPVPEPAGFSPAAAFSFDEPEPKKGKKGKKSEAPAPVPEPAGFSPAAGFSFDEPEPEPEIEKGKKGKKAEKGEPAAAMVRKPATGRSKGSKFKTFLILGGLFFLSMIVAVGGGVYWFVIRKPEVAQAPTTKADPTSNEQKPGKGTPETKGGKGETPTTKPNTTPPIPVPKDPPAGPITSLPTAPAAPALFAKAKRTAIVDADTSLIRAIQVSSSQPAFVVVAFNTFLGFQGTGATDKFERYSLDTGVKAGAIELTADNLHWPRPFALNKAGTLMAIEAPAGKVTVFDFDANAKVLDGAMNGAAPVSVAALTFTAAGQLIVVDKAGTILEWDLKTKKPTVRGNPATRPAGAPPARACKIDDKQQLVFLDGTLSIVDVTNGAVATTIPIAPAEAKCVPIAVTADLAGNRAAVLYSSNDAGSKHTFAIVDLKSKAVLNTIPILPTIGTPLALSWLDQETIVIMMGNREASLIYDVEKVVMVGYIKAAAGRTLQYQTQAVGSHWWAVPEGKPKKSILVSVQMPFDAYADLVPDAKKSRQPIYLVPQKDGLAK